MTLEQQAQTLSFEAEVGQLLHLMANALYSNKEVFLRELISNASDAADKLRFLAMTDSALYENDAELKIWVDFDKQTRTLTIRDNGIGMNREEVVKNLGTIARSGTRKFLESMSEDQAKSSQLIGQFGVGFYSAFVVADMVTVRTRRAGTLPDQGVVWTSDGKGQFEVKNAERTERGTEVVLHLKAPEDEFLDAYRLRGVIRKYSDHILLPIVMKKPKVDKAEEENEAEQNAAETTSAAETEEEVVNSARALWALPKNEITDAQYQEFYKHLSHDFEEALAWSHNRVEGKLEYTTLLYIPKRPPFDLYNRDRPNGLQLYVRRVFIMADAEALMPLYLRFVKGIVDSNDLPLNVSRELLQSDKTIENIRAACVKRVLSMLEKMAESEPEKYATFWKAFGAVIKEGPAEDYANRDKIAELLRFASTHNETEAQTVSFKDYVGRMKKDQDKIYYLVADSFLAAKNSPLLEVFRSKGVEVLLLSDKVDEWLVGHYFEFEGKKLQSIAKGALDIEKLDTEEVKEVRKQEKEAHEKDFATMLQQLKTLLKDKVKDVRLTDRLVDSPACVVFDEHDMSGHLQRLMAAAGQAMPKAKPIFELNPKHPLVERLKAETDDQRFDHWSEILFQQALLAEGEALENPADFVKKLNGLLLELSK